MSLMRLREGSSTGNNTRVPVDFELLRGCPARARPHVNSINDLELCLWLRLKLSNQQRFDRSRVCLLLRVQFSFLALQFC